MRSQLSARFWFTGLLAIALLGLSVARADETAASKELTAKGVKLTLTGDVATALDWPDASSATAKEYELVRQLPHLKRLNIGKGLSDAGLAILVELPEVEAIQVNSPQWTDEGFKALAKLKSLKGLSVFHPGKEFTGSGVKALAALPSFQKLTIAGSAAFADEGMAGVASLENLEEFRTWHTGVTLEGVSKLKKLKKLRSLNIGQRLSFKPPASVTDAIVPVLAEIKTLESIQLSEAKLSAAALAGLKQLPALKSLKLNGVMLAEGDLEKLKAELPKVQITWTAPTEADLKRMKALGE